MPPFTACIAQTVPRPYEKGENLRRALAWMDEAAGHGASLLLLPEMFLTGYLVRDRLAELTEALPDGPAVTALRNRAQARSLALIVGMPVENPDGGRPYNAMVMIDRDGSIPAVACKTHMFGGEEKMFTPGDSLKAFDTTLGRMGILVCYDGEFPETARTLALDGAKLICHCAANMTPYEDYHPVYMRARAMENCVYTLYCNYVGAEKRFRYCGQSGAWHPTGRVLAQGGTEEETLFYVPVDLSEASTSHGFLRELDYLNRRRPELYHPDLTAMRRK